MTMNPAYKLQGAAGDSTASLPAGAPSESLEWVLDSGIVTQDIPRSSDRSSQP